MKNRIKPTPYIISDIKQVEGALAEISALSRKLTQIETSMNAAIDSLKSLAKGKSAPLEARNKELADAIGIYSTLNKQDLFKTSKSLDLGFGIIGFRQSTKIKQLNKITAEMTLEKLQEYKFTEGLSTKTAINKDGMATWTDERLELVGLKRSKKDAFYIEIKAEELQAK